MSCLKGKQKAKPKPGRYGCTKCGGIAKKKKDVCKPIRIETPGKKKKGKKDRK